MFIIEDLRINKFSIAKNDWQTLGLPNLDEEYLSSIMTFNQNNTLNTPRKSIYTQDMLKTHSAYWETRLNKAKDLDGEYRNC